MKKAAVALLLAGISGGLSASVLAAGPARERTLFTAGWQFFKGDATGAEKPDFDASSWRKLDLPHDWSIEGPWDAHAATQGPGGYLPAGVGWYRRTFALPEAARGRKVTIEFGGVYMNSDVWINGRHVGRWPFGYTSFEYDLTPHLHFGKGKPNVLAVRVDNSRQPNSRWYSGSGVYRDVWLTIADPLRVAHWGTYVTTSRVSSESATLRIRTRVQNDRRSAQAIALTSQILGADGRVVASTETGRNLAPAAVEELDQSVDVRQPRLWSPQSPEMYSVRSLVKVGGQIVDEYVTPIGVREIAYDVEKGFLLNGRPVKMQGMCLHHDAGNLGAAVPEGVWRRRLEILKQMGTNALRTSHNPPDPVLLDLCDRMGLLVMDEAFDEWTIRKPQISFGYSDFFSDWYEKDLVNMIRRDRNHPSVVMWSAGNEVGEQTAPDGHLVLGKLVDVFHREDPTRPVTVGMDDVFSEQGPAPTAFTDLLDVVGYNYVDRWGTRRETYYADDRHRFPTRRFVGTESSTIGGIRGDYSLPPAGASQTDGSGRVRRGYTANMIQAEALWKFVKVHDYVIGDFGWTGIDYLGETRWPRRGAASGQLDTCAFPKDSYYLYQSQWTDKPMIHLLPHWTWPGREGEIVPVVVYTNADTVELFLNGTSLGARSLEFPRQGNSGGWLSYARPVVPATTGDLHLSWDVPYAPGTLRAVGRRDGEVVAEAEVRTTGAPAAIALSADRQSIRADGRDVVHVTVQVVDREGLTVPLAASLVRFDLQGPGTILALDNGDLADLTSPRATQYKVFGGMALAIVQSRPQTGRIRLTARSEGLKEAAIEIDSRR